VVENIVRYETKEIKKKTEISFYGIRTRKKKIGAEKYGNLGK
jgi:hypothetical protein